jgi:HYR domain
MRAVRLILLLLLVVATPLLARDVPTIATVSPSSIYVMSGEWFVTLEGSHYLPSAGATVIFSGPGGTYSLSPSTATDSRMVVWVPLSILLTPGNYSVKVRVPNGAGTLDSNSTTLHVIADSVFLQVPLQVLVEATSLKGGIGNFEVIATSFFGGATSVECSHRSGEVFPFDVTKVDCKAYDEFGGSASESFEILVADTTPPSITVPRELTVFGKPDGSSVKYEVTAADVVDGDVTVKCSPESGSLFRVGTTTVTCTSADRFKNVGKSSFRVHVGDDDNPALIVPIAVVAEATSREGAIVSYEATATDSAGKPADVRCDPKAGSNFLMGLTTVKCTAFGPTGKSITEAFDVSVVDSTAPELFLPREVTEQAPDPDGAVVSYSAAAKDSVDGETFVDCYPKSGSLFAPGVTTVHCSSIDKAENKATGSFDVTVLPWFDDTVYARRSGSSPKNR